VSREAHDKVLCAVQVIKHLYSVLVVELSGIAHGSSEPADGEGDIGAQLRGWIEKLADERLVARCELSWSYVIFHTETQLESLRIKWMEAAGSASTLHIRAKLVNIGLHGEFYSALSSIATDLDT
jgi:hypothetical protein